MKRRYDLPELAVKSFWGASVHSESGIAHLVTLSHDYDLYRSCCGLDFALYEVKSAGQSGIGAPRCKRCMSSKEKDSG